jgi:hypothetical protein
VSSPDCGSIAAATFNGLIAADGVGDKYENPGSKGMSIGLVGGL